LEFTDSSCQVIVHVSQSKKAGLEGSTDADFAISEMLMVGFNFLHHQMKNSITRSIMLVFKVVLKLQEEWNDIYNIIAKAHYSEPREPAMDAVFAQVFAFKSLFLLCRIFPHSTTFSFERTKGFE
jgi:hypothetical protein